MEAYQIIFGAVPIIKMKCTIQWIDADGEPTPDNNEAVALVRCTDTINCSGKKHPICQHHLKRLKYLDNWEMFPLEDK